MLISEYISKDFPAFEVDSSAEEALEIASNLVSPMFCTKNNLFWEESAKNFWKKIQIKI